MLQEAYDISEAVGDEFEWCARLMAGSEPWITLGRSLEQCRAALRFEGYRVYVARRDGRLSGFIRVQQRGVAGSPYIATVAVDPAWRGQGVGTLLLRFAESLFVEARHIFICVSSFNPRARALYERQGYRRVAELADYIIEGESEILMHKRLPDRGR